MIVADEGRELRIVTQSDHAHFAGELLALWLRDGLPDHPRRADLLFAVREHDNGWREADAAPRVDLASGRSHDFLSFPGDARLEVWRRSTSRYAARRPYVALLIAEHAQRLHSAADALWIDFLADLRTVRRLWVEETGLDDHTVRTDYRFLQLADALSLAVCRGATEPFHCRGVSARFDGECLLVEPFPLAGPTTFRVPCRRIPARLYRGDSELASTLARARWQRFPVRVAPGRRACERSGAEDA